MSTNPYERLLPAWEKYKRSHSSATREVSRSYTYRSKAIQQYRFSQGLTWNTEARLEWDRALKTVLDPKRTRTVIVEWVGDAKHPACLVNGVMMFV